MRLQALIVSAAVVGVQIVTLAGDQKHEHAPTAAEVGFGVFPTVPLGDAMSGCAQTGVGGPTDPCAVQASRAPARGVYDRARRRGDVPRPRRRSRDGDLSGEQGHQPR